ncbi:MAG: 50S ribosome-binding GTPase [Phycisphaeraceae bacterium]|nr:50S ribosome-binding GTPase [Phycisphaeraceae bacterium]
MSSKVQLVLTTAPNPGAVAVMQLHGAGAVDVLEKLTGVGDWPPGRLRLVLLAGVDQGLGVALREDWAQMMPHGGPRVVQRLMARLRELGVMVAGEPDPVTVYPEAEDEIEAHALTAVARAASPAAIELLLGQAARWREWLRKPAGEREGAGAILARSKVLNQLIEPATVVVVGRPNVGKSTLGNRMLGRAASLVADLPGTTRDWVGGLAVIEGVVVRWLDTPGVRETEDAVEAAAMELARGVMAGAQVVVAMRDPGTDWPEVSRLPRRPDVWVVNKVDQLADEGAVADFGVEGQTPMGVSAATGVGIEELGRRVLGCLGLGDVRELAGRGDGVWAWSAGMRGRLGVK